MRRCCRDMIDFGMNVQEAGDAPRFQHLGSSTPTGQRRQGRRDGRAGIGHRARGPQGARSEGAQDRQPPRRRLRRLPGDPDRHRSGHPDRRVGPAEGRRGDGILNGGAAASASRLRISGPPAGPRDCCHRFDSASSTRNLELPSPSPACCPASSPASRKLVDFDTEPDTLPPSRLMIGLGLGTRALRQRAGQDERLARERQVRRAEGRGLERRPARRRRTARSSSGLLIVLVLEDTRRRSPRRPGRPRARLRAVRASRRGSPPACRTARPGPRPRACRRGEWPGRSASRSSERVLLASSAVDQVLRPTSCPSVRGRPASPRRAGRGRRGA